ncbi:hypothetical protein Hanom_Chr04g00313901 [Helianthus anomalus]
MVNTSDPIATTRVVAKGLRSIPAMLTFSDDRRPIASDQYRRPFTGDTCRR